MPIYSVEKPGFQQLLKEFDPQYVLPSLKYFSKIAIPTLYAKTCEKVVSEIGRVQFFSATTDLWSSSGMTPYMSHYIHSDWTLQSKCLQTQFIPEDHTGENRAEAMQTTFDSWNLDASNQDNRQW